MKSTVQSGYSTDVRDYVANPFFEKICSCHTRLDSQWSLSCFSRMVNRLIR
jgi:hypothetical protein